VFRSNCEYNKQHHRVVPIERRVSTHRQVNACTHTSAPKYQGLVWHPVRSGSLQEAIWIERFGKILGRQSRNCVGVCVLHCVYVVFVLLGSVCVVVCDCVGVVCVVCVVCLCVW